MSEKYLDKQTLSIYHFKSFMNLSIIDQEEYHLPNEEQE